MSNDKKIPGKTNSFKYDPAKIKAAAARGQVGEHEIIKRAKYYLNEKDWHRSSGIREPIYLKPGVVGNELMISTGKPTKNAKHWRYTAHCQLCGTSLQITISQLRGTMQRACCGSSMPSQTYSRDPKRTPKHKLQEFTALVVRERKLCGGCKHIRDCSDKMYECECHREDQPMEYDLRGGCPLGSAKSKMFGMPRMTDKERSNDLGVKRGAGVLSEPLGMQTKF